MKDKIEFFLFLGFSALFRILGIDIARRTSRFFALIFYYLIPIRKSTVLENLRIAFPNQSNEWIKKTAFNCYNSIFLTFIEILLLPSIDKRKMESIVKCNEKELIIEKYNQNKGVILLSAHFGNWEYLAASVASQINIPFTVIVKDQSNKLVTKWMDKYRTKYINKVVPLGISIRQIYKELIDKNIVAMVADQRGPADGFRVEFFGRKAAIYPGPVQLALKTKAPILFGIAIRQPDYNYKVEVTEIRTDDVIGTDDEKAIELSQRHTNILEEYIKKYPEQWFWLHKRWKY